MRKESLEMEFTMINNSIIRVLIVDDEPSICESLVNFLVDYDFEVNFVNSAEEAIDHLKNSQYNVAIIDLRLPGMRRFLWSLMWKNFGMN